MFMRQSPPSRGAWIEILLLAALGILMPSPPSRGAWIEIDQATINFAMAAVAPLAGGVD